MRIGNGAAASGEMFATACDRLPAHPAVPLTREIDHALRVAPPATAAQSICKSGKMIEIEHRSKVEVEAQKLQQLAGQHAGIRNFSHIPTRRQGLGRWQHRRNFLGPRDASTFLIDADDWQIDRQVAQAVSELSRLLRRNDVARKKDVACRLQTAEQRRFVRPQIRPIKPQQQQGSIAHRQHSSIPLHACPSHAPPNEPPAADHANHTHSGIRGREKSIRQVLWIAAPRPIDSL